VNIRVFLRQQRLATTLDLSSNLIFTFTQKTIPRLCRDLILRNNTMKTPTNTTEQKMDVTPRRTQRLNTSKTNPETHAETQHPGAYAETTQRLKAATQHQGTHLETIRKDLTPKNTPRNTPRNTPTDTQRQHRDEHKDNKETRQAETT
jgi:hypothetical protein